MSKLIDAEKLDFVSYQGIPNGYKDSFDSGVLYAMNLIDEQPIVDATPVVHGHWEMKWHIYLHQELPVCSHCKKFVVAMSAYCPLCGTIMDEPTQSNDSNALDALERGKQCD